MAAIEETKARLSVLPVTGDVGLQFRASLHLGDVHYGNIGSRDRLDFTAIGPTVNLAFRLLSVASEMSLDLVCSQDFADLLDLPTEALGDYVLKGFPEPVPVYRPA